MNKAQFSQVLPAVFLPEKPIKVVPGRLQGSIVPPPSKSILHRALICAALTGEMAWLEAIKGAEGFVSADIKATAKGLARLLVACRTGGGQSAERPHSAERSHSAETPHSGIGVPAHPGGSTAAQTTVSIGSGNRQMMAEPACFQSSGLAKPEPVAIDCGESGSTLRFLLPVAAALGIEAVFTGAGALPDRPLRDYANIFEDRVHLGFPAGGRSLPLQLKGRLKPGHYRVPGHVSSQYITGLLLALPLTGGECTVELTSPLASGPYVDLTLDVMAAFGVEVIEDTELGSYGGWRLSAASQYKLPASGFRVEPDFSQAAFWLVARFIGHPIEVRDLPAVSRQGDSQIVAVLDQLQAIRQAGAGNLYLAADDIPDLVPILSVAAATVPGTHVFAGVKRLRLKECDRLQATQEMLASTGLKTAYDEVKDELTVYGISPFEILSGLKEGATPAPTYGDHRMAMAQTILGCSAKHGYIVDRPGCVAKSWPDFYRDFARLGGTYMEVD